MLYVPLALALFLYLAVFFGIRFLLRCLKGGRHYLAIWALLLVLALSWLIVVAAVSGGRSAQLLGMIVARPNEDPWAMKSIGLLSLFVSALPLPLAVALLTARPHGRWWGTRSFCSALVLSVIALAALHFEFRRTCLLSVQDQFGNPVPNASVTYYLDGRAKRSTDASGMLRIPFYRGVHRLHIRDADVGGFVIDYRLSSHHPYDPIPTSATLPAWKVLRAPQLLLSRPHISVVTDGDPHFINLLREEANRETLAVVDLEVRVQAPANIRNPSKAHSERQPFPWSVDIRVQGGGLQRVGGPYQYVAPADGYTNSYTKTFEPNDTDWNASFQQTFYFHLRGGKAFAVAEVTVTSLLEENSMIFVDAKINPAADRNLFWGYGNLLSHSRRETAGWLSQLFGDVY